MIGVAFPYHDHLCPGLSKGKGLCKPHRRHVYPCHNPNCQHGRLRHCGLIVDAILTNKRQEKWSVIEVGEFLK